MRRPPHRPRPVPVPLLVAALLAACGPAEVEAADPHARLRAEVSREAPHVPQPPDLGWATDPDRGDLPRVLDQQRLRVLVPPSAPFFLLDGARPTGLTVEVFREFGAFLEERHGLAAGALTVVAVPCPPGHELDWLLEGYGDVAAGALTITPERAARVAFTDPIAEGVDAIVVRAADVADWTTWADLAGHELWLEAGSSHLEHLAARNAELTAAGLAPVRAREAPPGLTTDDLLEMVHAGILDAAACDGYQADLWSQALDGLVPEPALALHTGGRLAWAVRPDNPALLRELNAFVPGARQGSTLGNVLIRRYFGSTRWVLDPTDEVHRSRLRTYSAWLRELGAEHGFDWVRLGAQCFQESGLDPAARSRSGALGLMQLLPSTAADMGCTDPLDPEQNLRAGVRYLAWLREHFLADVEDPREQHDLLLAAYNAGPGNVRKWRRMAPDLGIDPDRWRGHVERIALQQMGVQPVRYVDAIEKYTVAYRLTLDLVAEREAEREALGERAR